MPVVALGLVLAHELNADVQQRSIDAAKTSATLIARVAVQPLLTQDQMTNGLTPDELVQMDSRLQGAAVGQDVSRIKVWNPTGKLVYSDNPALIGKTYPIDDELHDALGGKSGASLTNGQSAENAGDTLSGPLIQVYVPIVFAGSSRPSGAFEIYLPYAPVQAAIDNESKQLYLLLAAGLTVFYASMFPVVLIAERWRRRRMKEAESTALANLAVLERLNQLKSEFLVRISHQFRTALVGIEGFSEVIRESDRLDLDEAKSYAADIYEDAQRLDKAFSDMLELDQMETGRTVLKLERNDINEIVSRAVDSTRVNSAGHGMSATLAPSVPAITCDGAKITQVLEILLTNAVKYSRPGRDVAVTTRLDERDVEVSVADRGPGMPPGFDRSLFVSGTGLGLPIARQIITMHGGRIWYESEAGKGTVFHFTIPLTVQPSRILTAISRSEIAAAEEAQRPLTVR